MVGSGLLGNYISVLDGISPHCLKPQINPNQVSPNVHVYVPSFIVHFPIFGGKKTISGWLSNQLKPRTSHPKARISGAPIRVHILRSQNGPNSKDLLRNDANAPGCVYIHSIIYTYMTIMIWYKKTNKNQNNLKKHLEQLIQNIPKTLSSTNQRILFG